MKQYHDAPNNKKNTVPGHGYFAKLASFEEEHCEKGDLYMEYRKMSCQEKNGELCEYCRAFFKSYFRYTYSTTLSQLQQTSWLSLPTRYENTNDWPQTWWLSA